MKIAIMGAGFVGESLGRALVKAGHEVMLSSRTPQSDRMQALSADLGNAARVGTVQETLAFSDVVAMALRSDAVADVVHKAGDWSGKVVLDMTQGDLTTVAGLETARIVKIFNSIGAEHYQNPDFAGQPASMLYCGDDDAARIIAAGLARDLGFDPIDAGGIDAAPHLVNLARLWIHLAFQAGHGRDVAFKLVRK